MKINKFKAPDSISSTISLGYMVGFSVVILALSLFVLSMVKYLYAGNADKEIENVFLTVNVGENTLEEMSKLASEKTAMSFVCFDGSKKIIFKYGFINELHITNEIGITDKKDLYIENEHFRIGVFKIKSDTYLMLLRNMKTEDRLISIFTFTLIIGVIISFVIVLLLGYSVTRYLLRPIIKMTQTINDISVNNMNMRLDEENAKSELKELAKTFNTMLDKIESSYNAKQAFVSGASHELRTPLSIISGYSDLLSRWGKDDEKVLMEGIYAISTQTKRMQTLIEKMLFLVRAEDSNFQPEFSEFDCKELLDDIAKDMNLISKNVNVVSLACEDITIRADVNLITQLVIILCDNAIKYSQSESAVELNCMENTDYVIITVRDYGIGIKDSEIDKIFDKFYRVDKARSKELGGFGLGLSIAKQIVLSHNGKIEIESKEGDGTKIMVYVPK